ncbi:hypothetical protein ACFX11_046579 [Malus domestica]
MTIKSFFHSLQRGSVYECPKLKDLTWLIFAPNLVTIDIHDCPEMEQIIYSRQLSKIEELPLDSSVNRRNVVIEGEEEWWNGLEWEDGATRNDFISCFRNLNI